MASKSASSNASFSGFGWKPDLRRNASIYIFLLAFSFRVAILFSAHTWPDNKQIELTNVVQSIVKGEGFSNAYSTYPTGPTAHVAPLYPYLLAAIFRIFGFGGGDFIVQLLTCATTACIYSLLPAIAEAAELPRSVGIIGGFIGAVVPQSIEMEVIGRWEAGFATLLFVCAILLWLRHLRGASLTVKRAVGAGFVWGLLFLTSPVFLPVLCSLIVVFSIARHQRANFFRYVVILLFTCALVVSPWIVRNYRTFGALFWIRSNPGLEFYFSNAPCSRVTLAENIIGPCRALHPNLNPEVARHLAAVGETAFNHECMLHFRESIQQQPGLFVQRTLKRVLWMWFPVSAHPLRDSVLIRDILSCLISALGLVGFFLIPWRGSGRLTLATAFLSFPVVYYFIQTATRYRFPILWMYFLFSAVALLKLYEHFPIFKAAQRPSEVQYPSSRSSR